LQPHHVFRPYVAGSDRRDRKQPEWREPQNQTADSRHRFVECVKGLKQRRFSFVSDLPEGHAGKHAEEDDCWNQVIGECVEQVRRDVEIDPIDRERWFLQCQDRGTNEGRESKLGADDKQQRQAPRHQQEENPVARERFHFADASAAEARNQRSEEVRKNVNLQQPDKSGCDDAERGCRFAEEDPDDDAGADPRENLVEHGRGTPVDLTINAIDRREPRKGRYGAETGEADV
jgi:hypothetical protein